MNVLAQLLIAGYAKIIAPNPSGFKLREDGSFKLREDGSFKLRE